jgi:phospholipase/carboxylesterase
MAAAIDGPRLEPRSGKTKQLVVFLHGYGADGNDLIALGQEWKNELPDAAFVSPHAPEPCGGAPTGRQWFELTFRNPDERWRGVNKAVSVLQNFLDAELQRRSLTPDALALVGFSQGTMMALHAGLRRQVAPAAIVGFSGIYVTPESENGPGRAASEIRSRPPILLVHGTRDDLIPMEALFASGQMLAAAEVPVEWHLSHGVGHGIDGEGLRHGGQFLANAFARKPKASAALHKTDA